MQFTSYLRKPFKVSAIEITEDNLEELAKDIGTIVEREDGSKYIQVDRRLVPNVLQVYPGFVMTKVRKQVRCFPPGVFNSLFIKVTADVQSMLDRLNATDDNPANFPHEGEIIGDEKDGASQL